MINYAKRAEKFDVLVKKKPEPGQILMAKDRSFVPVYVEIDPISKNRVVYTNALIDDDCTGWYLTKEIRGLKVLILPNSQEHLIKENNGSCENLSVAVLRIVRHNKKGTALIAEIVERD